MAKSIFILSFITLLIILLVVTIFIHYKETQEYLKDDKLGFAYYFAMVILASFLVLTALVSSLF